MTARTDINLPPLPQSIVALDDCFPTTTSKVLTWGRAAVEADRQGRMPSDAELDDLSDEFHGYSGNHTRDGYLIPKFDYIGYARALLSRYGSSQLAAADGVATLRAALAADPDYAWSWHCAVWAAAHDEGLETGAANRAAARLMRAAFDVDTTKNPNFSPAHLVAEKEQQ